MNGAGARRPPGRRGVTTRAVAALAFGLALVGCQPTVANPFAPPGTDETSIVVYVENRGFNEFRLYAISARGMQSMGVVGGNSQSTLGLAWRQLDQLSFRLEVLAGRSHTTHAVTVSPGDRVELIVPSNPAGAQVRVR